MCHSSLSRHNALALPYSCTVILRRGNLHELEEVFIDNKTDAFVLRLCVKTKQRNFRFDGCYRSRVQVFFLPAFLLRIYHLERKGSCIKLYRENLRNRMSLRFLIPNQFLNINTTLQSPQITIYISSRNAPRAYSREKVSGHHM